MMHANLEFCECGYVRLLDLSKDDLTTQNSTPLGWSNPIWCDTCNCACTGPGVTSTDKFELSAIGVEPVEAVQSRGQSPISTSAPH